MQGVGIAVGGAVWSCAHTLFLQTLVILKSYKVNRWLLKTAISSQRLPLAIRGGVLRLVPTLHFSAMHTRGCFPVFKPPFRATKGIVPPSPIPLFVPYPHTPPHPLNSSSHFLYLQYLPYLFSYGFHLFLIGCSSDFYPLYNVSPIQSLPQNRISNSYF